MTDTNTLSELITLKEASTLLNVHPNTLRQWDNKKILVAVRIGERKTRMYRKIDIENVINNKSEAKSVSLDENQINRIRDIIQSSNLNFLVGSGLSTPFLPILNDIETRLNEADNDNQRDVIRKEYLTKVMLPNKRIVDDKFSDESEREKYVKAITQYKVFLNHIAEILFDRKGTILSKQANIFTSNMDIFIEEALEANNLEYNDGFSGKIVPIFDISNFKKTIHKRSLHFENVSEIPTFNLVKIHGSLTWKHDSNVDKIRFSNLDHFGPELLSKNGSAFQSGYDKILIVNPERSKFQKTVIEVIYYELLRLYSSELEKENSVLFVLGFSMSDAHIREITLRSANSNPTLTIFIICHGKNKVRDMKKIIGKPRYNNIEIIEPADNNEKNKLDLEKVNNLLFKRILDVEDHHAPKNE